jgi:PadR family transcriptional regulator, regulatory protein PadR
MEHQELLSGLIRLHVLHHAAEGDLYGNWMIEELAHHGYKISPGTLYPMLHALEKKGYLSSRTERAGRSQRRIYRATPYGVEALAMARAKVRELVREVAPEAAHADRQRK